MDIMDIQNVCYVVKVLRKYAKTVHRCDENDCNGFNNEQGEKRNDNKRKRALLRAQMIVEERLPKFEIFHQGDPRGCALYLVPKNYPMIDNCYNSAGMAIEH